CRILRDPATIPHPEADHVSVTEAMMISDTSRFRCPEHRHSLRWPQALCVTCGHHYRLSTQAALTSGARDQTFDLYDFRPSQPEIELDRLDASAHRKIVEGLLWFERRKLEQFGFADLRAGLHEWAGRPSGLLARGLYAERTLRNIMEWIWHAVTKQ